MLNVRDEVEKLLAEMRSQAETIEQVQDTIEISAIVRQMAMPIIDPSAPPSFVPAMARATLLGAWVQHDAMRALQRLST